jgi:hypothetical protein
VKAFRERPPPDRVYPNRAAPAVACLPVAARTRKLISADKLDQPEGRPGTAAARRYTRRRPVALISLSEPKCCSYWLPPINGHSLARIAS